MNREPIPNYVQNYCIDCDNHLTVANLIKKR